MSENNWDVSKDTKANASANSNHEKNLAGATNPLLSLLSEASILGSQRDVPEVTATLGAVEKTIEALKKGSLTDVQRKILPNATILTKQISSGLPGLVLHMKLSNTMFVQPVLFANRALTQTMEDIDVSNGSNQRRVSMPLTPISYVRKELLEQIRTHFLNLNADKGVNDVCFLNFLVLDLDQYQTEEVMNAGKENVLCDVILRGWEQGLQVAVAKQQVAAGITNLPAPFVREGNIYGPHNTAVARVEPVVGTLVRDGVPSGANLSVRLQTSNQYGGVGTIGETSKEIVTAYATVQLLGNPMQTFRPDPNANYGANFPQPNGRPNGYFPLMPMIVYNFAKPGELLGDKTGLSTYFEGLYALLSTNNNYLFTEGLRGKNVGSRGNLAMMEGVIRQAERVNQIPRDKNAVLTEQKLADVDFTNNWIRQNIGPKAIFAVDLIQFGKDAALSNFLLGLTTNHAEFSRNTKVVVAVLDSLCRNAFSTVIKKNIDAKSGWVPGKPILHASPTILPFGTFREDGKLVDLSEVDEMKLTKLFPNDTVAPAQWMQASYGDNGATPDKVRQYNLRMQLNQMFSSEVNLNGFGGRFYYDPEFMLAMGAALDTVGQLQASGSMGTFQSNVAIYASGLQFAVAAAAGNAGGFVTNNGASAGNGSALVFGS